MTRCWLLLFLIGGMPIRERAEVQNPLPSLGVEEAALQIQIFIYYSSTVTAKAALQVERGKVRSDSNPFARFGPVAVGLAGADLKCAPRRRLSESHAHSVDRSAVNVSKSTVHNGL